MPRPLRIEYAGACYHIMCRGNQGMKVFGSVPDRELWLKTLGEAMERTGWQAHAWVLMDTHYHLLLETPEPNLVEGMKWLQGTFTQRYNSLHKSWGHVYQGRYKAKIIDDEDPHYFLRVADYIHLNPVAAGLVRPENLPLKTYAWSSYPDYLKPPSGRPGWLQVGRVLLGHHVTADSVKGRRAFGAGMDVQAADVLRNRRKAKWRKEWQACERGWIHGGEDFRERMHAHLLEQDEGLLKPVYDGEQRRSRMEAAAERDLKEALEALGLKEPELEKLAKGDPRKKMLAGWAKSRYTVTNGWLSGKLKMGHPTNISRAYAEYRHATGPQKRLKSRLENLCTPRSIG